MTGVKNIININLVYNKNNMKIFQLIFEKFICGYKEHKIIVMYIFK